MGKILNDEKSDFYQFKGQVCNKLGLNASNNIQEECSSKAYDILEDLLHKGITFEGFTLELYEKLKKGNTSGPLSPPLQNTLNVKLNIIKIRQASPLPDFL